MRGAVLIPLAIAVAAAQQQAPPIQFVCPMDPDVRSATPGKCPRCGMTMEAGIPQPIEYRLTFSAAPARIPAGEPVELRFELIDPRTNQRATKFEVVHEKFFHLFLVGSDLNYFVHDHPVLDKDGVFRFTVKLPHPGIYRLLADAYPTGATPQLLPRFLTSAGFDQPISQSITHPPPDLTPKQTENMSVSLRTDPPEPIPGRKTMLFFTLNPGEGIEPYIGAWGHLLAVSNDLIDSIHEHPIYANGGPEIQFNIYFPREATYRVWVQFQRKGVVNTAAFTIPVKSLR